MFKTAEDGHVYNDDKKNSSTHHGSVRPQSGIQIKIDKSLKGNPEASIWKGLTTGERFEVIQMVFHPSDNHGLHFYDLKYWTEFSPQEQRAIMDAISKMPVGKREWHILDSAEQELLLYGKKSPFFKERIEKLPESVQKQIIPEGYEKTSPKQVYDNIKNLKKKFAGRTNRAWYNDNRHTREAGNRNYGEHNDLSFAGDRFS